VYLCGFVAAFPVAVWVWTFDTSRHIGTCCVMKLFCYHKLLLYSVQYNSWLVVISSQCSIKCQQCAINNASQYSVSGKIMVN